MQANINNPGLASSSPENTPTTGKMSVMKGIANIIGLILTWGAWLWLANQSNTLSMQGLMWIAFGGLLALLPLIFIARWLLDHSPTIVRAEWITLVIHYLVAILFGSAILASLAIAQRALSGEEQMPFEIRLPAWSGLLIMIISGVLLLLVVINLLVKGSGLPFALSLTRVVATDWLYAWTRNPMVLSALAFLVGMGLWLQSGLFLVWVLVVASPVMMIYLKVFEERELEIRFGQSYIDYKANVPMFIPKIRR